MIGGFIHSACSLKHCVSLIHKWQRHEPVWDIPISACVCERRSLSLKYVWRRRALSVFGSYFSSEQIRRDRGMIHCKRWKLSGCSHGETTIRGLGKSFSTSHVPFVKQHFPKRLPPFAPSDRKKKNNSVNSFLFCRSRLYCWILRLMQEASRQASG